MNPYYSPTPISEKPENEDWYLVKINPTSECYYYGVFKNGSWYKSIDEDGELIPYHTYYPVEWLKPVTGVLMTESDLQAIWGAAIAWYDDMKEYPDFNEYKKLLNPQLKRFKQ